MTVRATHGQLRKTAEKWRDLAERRRDHFRELHRSGLWRLYYDEEEFVARLRDIARNCDRWQMLVEETQPIGDAVTPPVVGPQTRSAA
jgi:hypothetical protein